MQSKTEKKDYSLLIPFHSLQLITSKSMFTLVLDVIPHLFHIISLPIYNCRHPESSCEVFPELLPEDT